MNAMPRVCRVARRRAADGVRHARAAAPAPATAPRARWSCRARWTSRCRTLAGALENAKEEKVQGWTFWRGTIDGYPVVISKTLKGMSNAAAATALAAQLYHPAAIINQGTAGGHQPDLHVYDIVLGTHAVNLGSFKTGYRARGKGSNFAEWIPLDLMRTEGSAGEDPEAHTMRRFRGDEGLLAAASSVRGTYRKGRVVEGVIGSSESVEQRDRSHPALPRPVRHDRRRDGDGVGRANRGAV